MKKQAKKASAAETAEMFKTGGGQNESKPIFQIENSLLEMVQDQIKPFKNPYDNDKEADILLKNF